ncbi:uncharacterized protein TNCV_2659701 [Trichonephila clavipes]|uniref:Uncharacterized protein n=1 Tax=Trichonephila clavipes TaxID=2585209 RepID=A0A8X6V0E7_TRICX|nr:uncharacterized protein TNCV_2659701 [Trichonephila clavipes]
MVYGLNGSILFKPLTYHGARQHTKFFWMQQAIFNVPFEMKPGRSGHWMIRLKCILLPIQMERIVSSLNGNIYGVFFKPIKKLDTEPLLENLGKYWKVYEYFRSFTPPPYRINETLSRKPVTCVASFHGLEGIVTHKLDGTFGLVYSFPKYIKEKWEGGIHKIRKGITLGDGIVFSAEKLSNDMVVLLDVYQVREFPTVQWNRENVLIHFLLHLSLPEGYETQKYCHKIEDLPMTRYETDGYIIHNTKTDKIVKVKLTHSLYVVYMDSFFLVTHQGKT